MIIHSLSLLAPLFYFKKASDPFDIREEAEKDTIVEKLFCFEIDESQYLSFEPERTKLLEKLVFSGVSIEMETDKPKKASLELPKGNYLFAQKREILSREEIISLAVEIQLEALWQRLKPDKKLYLRYLYEDGSWVTQLFRPYAS